MKILLLSSSLAIAVCLASLGGCSTASEPQEASRTTVEHKTVQPVVAERLPEHLLVDALRQPLDLTPQQSARISTALAAIATKAPPAIDRPTIFKLAASVRAGNVDVESTRSKTTARATATDALRTLHATLTKRQRHALVGALYAHVEDPTVVNVRAARIHRVLEELDVTPSQKQAIDTKITEANAAAESFDAEMRARLRTFGREDFDAAAYATPPVGAAAGALEPNNRLYGLASDLAILTSVLQPAQRDQLADRIERLVRSMPGG